MLFLAPNQQCQSRNANDGCISGDQYGFLEMFWGNIYETLAVHISLVGDVKEAQ